MKKLKKYKNDILIILLFSVIYIGIALILTHGKYVFAAVTDFPMQHYVFPEYFRNLFYETKDLLPDFTLNIGGGQNIYNFAYYGLLNPYILLSYLLPMVPMITYIQVSVIVLLIVSIILMYYLVRKRCDTKISFISTLLFVTAGCLIFHLHRHIMFVNYLPFLLLALIGVDRYFDKKKCSLLIIATFLMILTSYYFSVVGLFTILFYGIFKYLEINKEKITVKDFFKDGFKFILKGGSWLAIRPSSTERLIRMYAESQDEKMPAALIKEGKKIIDSIV